jgi:hypothetical protein
MFRYQNAILSLITSMDHKSNSLKDSQLPILRTRIETSDEVARHTFTGVIDSSLAPVWLSAGLGGGFIYNQFSKWMMKVSLAAVSLEATWH